MAAQRLVDSHVHLSSVLRIEEFSRYLSEASITQAGIVSLPDRRNINFNPEAFAAKLQAPDRLFVFGGFDYTHRFHPEIASEAARLEDQVSRLAQLGADGIKMWAGKPPFQRLLGFGLDSEIYTKAFDTAGRLSMPIVLHVADPEVFWRLGGERFGWSLGGDDAAGYGDYPGFHELQTQAETVLGRHPGTSFIFPHLLFRTGNLESFRLFMCTYPNAWLDLSPGLCIYGDLHRQRGRAIEFFAEFRKRIMFGSDGMWFDPGHPYLPVFSLEKNLESARRLVDFLSTDHSMANPFAFTKNEIPRVDGLSLQEEILEPILGDNFNRLMGANPKPCDPEAVECYTREIAELRRAVAAIGESR